MVTNLLQKSKGLQHVTKDCLGFLEKKKNVSTAFLNSLCIQTSDMLCEFLWFLSVRGNRELRSK